MKLTIHFYVILKLRFLLYVTVPNGINGAVLTKYRGTLHCVKRSTEAPYIVLNEVQRHLTLC